MERGQYIISKNNDLNEIPLNNDFILEKKNLQKGNICNHYKISRW